jgi:hypothetical protein
MQDMRVFESELTKPLFVQFVVSGSMVYAVVYIRGTSVFSGEMKQLTNQLKDSIVANAKDDMVEKYGRVRYDETLSTFGSNEEFEQFLKELKLKTPKLGKLMQELSIQACLELVRKYQYAFYVGDMSKLMGSNTLRLQT